MTEYIPLLKKYADCFKEDPQTFIKTIGSLVVPKQIISGMYEYFLFKKEIEPIESLPKESKKRIWEIAKVVAEKKDVIMVSKSIYLLENITQTIIIPNLFETQGDVPFKK